MSNDLQPQGGALVSPLAIPTGLEGLDRADLIIPRAKLLQPLSQDVQEPGSDLKAGWIINSLTKGILPAEFVPVFIGYNWIKFNPRDKEDEHFDPAFEPGAVIYRTTDPQDPIVVAEGKFGPNGELPTITKFINFLSFFPGEPMPVVISFCKSSYKSGKQLVSLAMFTSEGGKIFTRKYKLTSRQEKNDKGIFYVLVVTPSGKADDETIAKANILYQAYKSKPIVVHEEEKAADEE